MDMIEDLKARKIANWQLEMLSTWEHGKKADTMDFERPDYKESITAEEAAAFHLQYKHCADGICITEGSMHQNALILPDSIDGRPVTEFDLIFFDSDWQDHQWTHTTNLELFYMKHLRRARITIYAGNQKDYAFHLPPFICPAQPELTVRIFCNSASGNSLRDLPFERMTEFYCLGNCLPESRHYWYDDHSLPLPDAFCTMKHAEFIYDGVWVVCHNGSQRSLTVNPYQNEGKSIEENSFRHWPVQKALLVKGIEAIGAWAFEGCKNLRELHLPDTLKKIGAYAFSYCTSLQKLSIPDSVQEIGEGAFQNCTGLTELRLPDHLRDLDPSIFEGCAGLSSLKAEA